MFSPAGILDPHLLAAAASSPVQVYDRKHSREIVASVLAGGEIGWKEDGNEETWQTVVRKEGGGGGEDR